MPGKEDGAHNFVRGHYTIDKDIVGSFFFFFEEHIYGQQ